MKIFIEKSKLKENLYSLMRRCGYVSFYDSYVKTLSGSGFDYPRFHLYIQETEKYYMLNLHLDQKRPSYLEKKAHSGEYTGEVVEKETERIKDILES